MLGHAKKPQPLRSFASLRLLALVARPLALAAGLITFALGCGDPSPTGDEAPKAPAKVQLPPLGPEDYTPFVRLPRTTERMRLFEQLESFMNVEEAKAVLPLDWRVTLDRQVAAKGLCPGHRTQRLQADGYVHLDTEGDLTLEFEDERLMHVLFAPSLRERKLYARRLQKAGILTGGRFSGPPDPTRPHFRVWMLLMGGSRNVSFEDTRLERELLTVAERCRKQALYEDAEVPIPPPPGTS